MKIPDLTKFTVSSAEGVLDILARGNATRAVAATNVHEHSSRSHSILQVEAECR